MSIHDPALLSQVRNMNSSYSPMEELAALILKEKLEKDKKKIEEVDQKFKPPTFSILQMIGLSPIVALGMAWVYVHAWNYTVDLMRTLH